MIGGRILGLEEPQHADGAAVRVTKCRRNAGHSPSKDASAALPRERLLPVQKTLAEETRSRF